jgi:regulator of cell morphogenesis and NO signaling
MTLNPEQTTREIAIRHPAAIPVFESLGIDYCCGGSKTLAEACKKAQVEWPRMVELLETADAPSVPEQIDWSRQRLDFLTWYIIDAHHGYVRRASLRLSHWLEKVVFKHGARHPEVCEIDTVFDALSRELAMHMMKEEHLLFPYIDGLVEVELGHRAAAAPPFGSAENPIQQMMAEHDNAGLLMAQIRALASAYQPPADACPTFRGLYHGLAEFERDLHQHVHLENNILFPRALELERHVRPTRSPV